MPAPRPLTSAEAAAIDTGHVVHAVDATGAYLGLLPAVQASAVATSAPPVPSWVWSAGQWQPPPATLAELKAARWDAMKARRDELLAGTFTCAGLVYDINATNITGATVRAMRAQAAGEPYAQVWVLADNSTTTLDAAGMVAVGEACATAVNALWGISIALRAQIEVAVFADDLAAIDWPD